VTIKTLHTLEEIRAVSRSERAKSFFDKKLVAKVPIKSAQNDTLVPVNPATGIKVAPFWQDEPAHAADMLTQRLLDVEAQAFRWYIRRHPSFALKLRREVLQRLHTAQKGLPAHLRIVLKAAYRPLEVQRKLFDDVALILSDVHPGKDKDEIYTITSQYVSDPDRNVPPHSTGGAVDVTLYNVETGLPLDMGSPINFPDERSWAFNFTGLADEQKNNRLLLHNAMVGAGFANFASEWWHYSYGDQRWALFYGEPAALYGSV
jgi:D-alanyl-D-alanine dipeptidase